MDFVEQVKSSVDIVKVIGEYVAPQKGWRQSALHRTVPFSPRKDAVLLGPQHASVL